MEASHEHLGLPQWLSITGQALELGLESGFRGRSTWPEMVDICTHITAGQCNPIGSYVKLNQLGEGSAYSILSTVLSDKFTRLSLRRRLPRQKSGDIKNCGAQASPDIP